jgi:hypothetical protein
LRAHFDALATADPAIPEQLLNRGADNWQPLFALADVVGGEWPEKFAQAALKIIAADAGEAFTPGTKMLMEIQEAFGKREWMSSSALAKAAGMSPKMLANRLLPYEIVPKLERRTDGPARGYRREWFNDAFNRYLTVTRVTDETDGK